MSHGTSLQRARRAVRPCRRAASAATRWAAGLAAVLAAPPPAAAQTGGDAARTLDRVVVTGRRPVSMPLEIPGTLESTTGAQIERAINASDAEDALKYLPSLNVRKRYIGDHDHAVLATRASGTGNSARSLVYADGILLSNLLGNGAGFTPRWGLLTPAEIERVDVLYGPFSAAYPGNSGGAIVDFVTRMPSRFEAHAKLQASTQHFRLYASDRRFNGWQGSASVGSRQGAWSWWVNVDRLDSAAQPIGYVVKAVPAVPSGGGTPVSGAVAAPNTRRADSRVLGTTGQTNTVQDHAKVKLAVDLTPAVRASYTFGVWHNDAGRSSDPYLRDAAGGVVGSGATDTVVNVDGHAYTVTPTDFSASRASLEHLAHGLSVKSRTGGRWDWEVAGSRYGFRRDGVRSQFPSAAPDGAGRGGPDAGRISDQHGTGWNTLALKGIWRPAGGAGIHTVEGGLQRDAFHLRTVVSSTADWAAGAATGAPVSSFRGDARLTSLWAQDAWAFAPAWKAVLGARVERWRAAGGAINGLAVPGGDRQETHGSPKAALSFQVTDESTLKASIGRAVRMPTVSELYQGSTVANVIVNNDPHLQPERSWTSEWSAERRLGAATSLRGTLFFEHTRDALYSQTNVTVSPNVSNVQNVDAVRTRGIELALRGQDVAVSGLDVSGSLTFADSIVTRNDKFPASVGKWQPRVPRWRASAWAGYAPSDDWSASLGVRYSGRQYGTLDNSDPNGAAYTGVSNWLVADLRLQWRIDRQWKASLGVDNLTNRTYWAFHPYPQRTVVAELRFDLP